MVLRVRVAIDFRDGTVELEAEKILTVERDTKHRPRSLTADPVVLMFEPFTILNTGEHTNNQTVSDLKRLEQRS